MSERAARLLVLALVLGLPTVALIGRAVERHQAEVHGVVELHGTMSERGGWTPDVLTAAVGAPLRLRLTSDDVMHGFAIGLLDTPRVDVKPGEFTNMTVNFSKPGRYAFYCTRWCGVNHWRMRGTIEVTGGAEPRENPAAPLYSVLGIDLDAPHPADITPAATPTAKRVTHLDMMIPGSLSNLEYYRTYSPVEIWGSLRHQEIARDLTEQDVWDFVARIWEQNSSPQTLAVGRDIYLSNCSACHGESGAGDGVMASKLAPGLHTNLGNGTEAPADFTDAGSMLGASPALLQGKIVRGGMGTGMPYWGPILTESQIWAVVHYIWSFQFEGGFIER